MESTLSISRSLNLKRLMASMMIVMGLLSAVFAVLIVSGLRDYEGSVDRQGAAATILNDIYQRLLVADDYLMNPGDRAKTQWQLQQQRISDYVDSQTAKFQAAGESDEVEQIKNGLQRSTEAFNTLVALYQANTGVDVATLGDQRASFASELTVNAQTTIAAASRLEAFEKQQAASALQRSVNLLVGTVAMFFAGLTICFFFVWRSASRLQQRDIRDAAILSGIGDGVIAIDRNWNVTLFNRTAAELTGWDIDAALGQPLRRVLVLRREHDRVEDVGFIEEAMAKRTVTHMAANTLLVRRDGREIHVGDSAAPVTVGGTITGVVIVFRDVEQELESQRVKSEFAYASHQVRTPLSQALSALSLAETEKTVKGAKEYIGYARIGLESVRRLMAKVLDVSDVENKRLSPKPVDVQLQTLLDQMWESLKDMADTKHIELHDHIDESARRVVTDPDLLGKALAEILHNGIVYSDFKSHLVVNAEAEHGELLIEIHSRGKTISVEEQELIFTKFFRASNKPEDVAGAGLGLYLAREYVKLLGGKIWFESKDSQTVFRIMLPIK